MISGNTNSHGHSSQPENAEKLKMQSPLQKNYCIIIYIYIIIEHVQRYSLDLGVGKAKKMQQT